MILLREEALDLRVIVGVSVQEAGQPGLRLFQIGLQPRDGLQLTRVLLLQRKGRLRVLELGERPPRLREDGLARRQLLLQERAAAPRLLAIDARCVLDEDLCRRVGNGRGPIGVRGPAGDLEQVRVLRGPERAAPLDDAHGLRQRILLHNCPVLQGLPGAAGDVPDPFLDRLQNRLDRGGGRGRPRRCIQTEHADHTFGQETALDHLDVGPAGSVDRRDLTHRVAHGLLARPILVEPERLVRLHHNEHRRLVLVLEDRDDSGRRDQGCKPQPHEHPRVPSQHACGGKEVYGDTPRGDFGRGLTGNSPRSSAPACLWPMDGDLDLVLPAKHGGARARRLVPWPRGFHGVTW